MTDEDQDKLDELITEVSDTSYRCGDHRDENDKTGYEILYMKAYLAEQKLKAFVLSLVRQCQ